METSKTISGRKNIKKYWLKEIIKKLKIDLKERRNTIFMRLAPIKKT